MSRDPSRELDDFRDALHAKAERDVEERAPDPQPRGNPERSSDPERQAATRTAASDPRFEGGRSILYDRDRGYRVRPS